MKCGAIGGNVQRAADAITERVGLIDNGDLSRGINWEVELVVNKRLASKLRRKSEEACIRTCSQ